MHSEILTKFHVTLSRLLSEFYLTALEQYVDITISFKVRNQNTFFIKMYLENSFSDISMSRDFSSESLQYTYSLEEFLRNEFKEMMSLIKIKI